MEAFLVEPGRDIYASVNSNIRAFFGIGYFESVEHLQASVYVFVVATFYFAANSGFQKITLLMKINKGGRVCVPPDFSDIRILSSFRVLDYADAVDFVAKCPEI